MNVENVVEVNGTAPAKSSIRQDDLGSRSRDIFEKMSAVMQTI
jgi:hypothetical protein